MVLGVVAANRSGDHTHLEAIRLRRLAISASGQSHREHRAGLASHSHIAAHHARELAGVTKSRSIFDRAARFRDLGARRRPNLRPSIWGINGQACAIVEAMGRVASNRDSDTVASYRQ